MERRFRCNERHESCCCRGMAILLICWACVSVAFCLALVSAAARRPAPKETPAECEPGLARGAGRGLEADRGAVPTGARVASLSRESAANRCVN